MLRTLYLLFGVVAYLIFFATFLGLVAFVGNLPGTPVSVDQGPEAAPVVAAVIDLALIALFGIQHSVMARTGFKQRWTRIVAPPVERSVYVLIASLILIAMMGLWRPIAGVVWSATNPTGVKILWALFGLGWLVVLISTFLINHFELFGLMQVWRHLRGSGTAPPTFRTPLLYRAVRHPIYAGFVLAFWAAPVMTLGHLLFAAGMTVYILVAIRYEEADLIRMFGTQYETYRKRAGMLIPKFGGGS